MGAAHPRHRRPHHEGSTIDIDDQGRARVHEAVLAQLLLDAGWERAQ
ncbi:hypothetical protein [Nocardioides panaciterrulae]|uniref:Uncharacterized protein n=1 Tax=Nocardioides panaciterrulae TaxID=661492 RepID=A0A7Y9E288_9ACTN|nr:hypothetical protein [Nocardioides panaciterrulae]NYD39919.1 hypothetical protein [Nocardioides panaciterrulae]